MRRQRRHSNHPIVNSISPNIESFNGLHLLGEELVLNGNLSLGDRSCLSYRSQGGKEGDELHDVSSTPQTK